MKSSIAVNSSGSSVPVLSPHSGHRLINEVTQEATISLNRYRQEVVHPMSRGKEQRSSQPVYSLTSDGVKCKNTEEKGNLLYAVA